MTTTIAIIAPGNMGAAVAARLTRHGMKVTTSLSGRSAASVARAGAAGMVSVDDEQLVQADFLLSIVPPKEALPLARHLAPALGASPRKPVYIDCNAVSPDTAAAVGDVVQGSGAHFLDACIIGRPPRGESGGPTFYVAGPEAQAALALNDGGLTVRALEGSVGAASALKMSYGGITKGLVALGSVMALAASRYGVGPELAAELAASQPQLTAWFGHTVPDMFPKAYRWVAEMDEIALFLRGRPEARAYEAIARVYENLDQDWSGSGDETRVLASLYPGKRE